MISLVAAYFYGADTFGFGSHDDDAKDSDDDKDSGDDDERSKIASRRAIQVKEIKITGSYSQFFFRGGGAGILSYGHTNTIYKHNLQTKL